MTNAFTVLIVMALLVEVSVDILKSAVPFIHGQRSQLSSMVLGVCLTVATATGLLSMMGVQMSLPWIDWFLTGLIISRGSNFIHDLLAKIRTT
ncbi:MAG: hypothetical protein FH749_05690 [Firmicutes bacterium]|nr:hypothetical protein [Bacillota bacterium]